MLVIWDKSDIKECSIFYSEKIIIIIPSTLDNIVVFNTFLNMIVFTNPEKFSHFLQRSVNGKARFWVRYSNSKLFPLYSLQFLLWLFYDLYYACHYLCFLAKPRHFYSIHWRHIMLDVKSILNFASSRYLLPSIPEVYFPLPTEAVYFQNWKLTLISLLIR